MLKYLKPISSIILAGFVLLISVGVSISKICCEKGILYIGIEAPACKDTQESTSSLRINTSCCLKKKVCCSSDIIKTCNSESVNIQYDFITTDASSKILFTITPILLNKYISNNQEPKKREKLTLYNGIPPPLYKKPILSKIQSFLS